MRIDAKPVAKLGHSMALGFRNSTFSAASVIEALVDAYGVDLVRHYVTQIGADLAEHGDSIYNSVYNSQLNMAPLPVIRKQNKRKRKAA